VMTCLKDLGMIDLSDVTPRNSKYMCRILLNNNWVGVYKDPKLIYDALKQYRRSGILNAFISISWKIAENVIVLFSDAGRCMRPIIISSKMDKIKKHVAWTEFVNGYTYEYTYDLTKKKEETGIEYIDCFETNSIYIAMNNVGVTKEHTHLEIHPCLSLSMYTNTIPFANHNQAPRNVFSGQQGKQAIGIYSTSFNHRIDTAAYVLHYPQRNLISTKMAKYSFKNNMPNGENLIVAVATYTGYNQEDSIIVNKSSIQRGMFNVTYFKSIVDSESSNPYTNERIIFKNPREMNKQGNTFKFKNANWSKLDEHGYPKENSFIDYNDAYIGKVHETTKELVENENDIFADTVKQYTYKDMSMIGDKTLSGTVDKVVKYERDGHMNVKIRMRKFRIPELGDKMASSHGQKGVCGMVMDQHDMPYTKDGIVPDIIVNPHAFPSRMTIAHLIECVLSKLCCHSGEYIDGTVFDNHNIESYFDTLGKDFKQHKYGDEIMYNGFTGEQIPTEIFFGPTYYYRLKHMVKDKINFRDSGPKESLTRQPTQGRANGGGLRIGEMETNAILGHGISSFIKESMMERSDKYSIDINTETGDGIEYGERTHTSVQTKVEIPYSMKLFQQEVQSMAVSMKLLTKEQVETHNH
jgi:DNA-directed RNA polymerase II subunit RPB2